MPAASEAARPSFGLLLGLLAACGGGGGGAAVSGDLDLGPLPGGEITSVAFDVHNGLGAPAQVSEVAAAPPFRIAAGALPATIPAGGTLSLPLQCIPVAPGAASGLVTLRLEGGGSSASVERLVRARFEAVTWSVTPPALDFDVVPAGETSVRSVVLTNLSARSPVTFTSTRLPGMLFEVLSPALPFVVEPGESAVVRLEYAPDVVDDHGGDWVLGPLDLGANVSVPVKAGIAPDPELRGEQVLDLGPLAFSAGLSPTLAFDVPADAVSILVEARGEPGDAFELVSLTGPDGRGYAPRLAQALPGLGSGTEVFAYTVPDTDVEAGQPVPGGGSYQVQFRLTAGTGSTARARVVLERRASTGAAATARLDLNVFLADQLVPTAATAASDPRLSAILARAAAILAAQGISLGDVTWYDLGSAAFDRVRETELVALFSASAMAAKVRANLFLVAGLDGQLAGLAGLAARIGGPRLNGTRASGVLVDVVTFADADFVGAAVAHELCHLLGLFHDVEADATATPDLISDTDGSPNLMAPVLTDVTLTNGQGHVLRRHAHLRAVPGTAGKPGVAPATAPMPEGTSRPASGWCWHCREGADPERVQSR